MPEYSTCGNVISLYRAQLKYHFILFYFPQVISISEISLHTATGLMMGGVFVACFPRIPPEVATESSCSISEIHMQSKYTTGVAERSSGNCSLYHEP